MTGKAKEVFDELMEQLGDDERTKSMGKRYQDVGGVKGTTVIASYRIGGRVSEGDIVQSVKGEYLEDLTSAAQRCFPGQAVDVIGNPMVDSIAEGVCLRVSTDEGGKDRMTIPFHKRVLKGLLERVHQKTPHVT